MKAGPLNRRIVIEQRTSGTDANGQPVDTWTRYAAPWAYIKGQTGMSAIRASGVQSPVQKYSFRIHYRPCVDESMRVVYCGTAYRIAGVSHDLANHDHTDIICEVSGQ